MAAKVRYSDAQLRAMSEDARNRALARLVEAARQPVNGELRELDVEIKAYEDRFGFSSERMRSMVGAGEMRETLEVCDWLMTLNRRERLAKRAAQAR